VNPTSLTIISSAHNIKDARLQRLAIFLAQSGFQVKVISPGESKDAPAGISFKSAPFGKGFLGRFGRNLALPFMANGSVIYCLAPDLAPSAYLISKLRRKYFIMDFFEDYQKVIFDRAWSKGPLGFIKAGFGIALAKFALLIANKADLVTVADDQLPPFHPKQRLVLRNYPFIQNTPTPYLNDKLKRNEVPLVFDLQPRAIYIGDIRTSRGLWEMVDLAKALPNWKFQFIGPVAATDQKLIDQQLDFPKNIELLGRLTPKESWQKAIGAWVGFSLLQPTPAFFAAMPSKIYEYAFMGIPVISSALPKAKAALLDGDFGLIATSPSQTIEFMNSLDSTRNKWAENGLSWISGKISTDLGYRDFAEKLGEKR
jgi:hypothetical protein